jgi:hypothetical protein
MTGTTSGNWKAVTKSKLKAYRRIPEPASLLDATVPSPFCKYNAGKRICSFFLKRGATVSG